LVKLFGVVFFSVVKMYNGSVRGFVIILACEKPIDDGIFLFAVWAAIG
jgi:hypothetical protein